MLDVKFVIKSARINLSTTATSMKRRHYDKFEVTAKSKDLPFKKLQSRSYFYQQINKICRSSHILNCFKSDDSQKKKR